MGRLCFIIILYFSFLFFFRACTSAAFAAAGGYAVDIGVAAHGHRIENPAPVGAPARRKGRIAALADQRLPAGTDVVDIDARIAVDIAQIDELAIIGRIARGQRGRAAGSDEAVVRPVAVHDRDDR